MAKNVVPDTTVRDEAKSALKEIKKNPDLRKAYERIDEKHRSLRRSDILGRYEIGKEVERVVSDENKYGSGAVRLLAATMMLNESDLYKWKDLATTWTADEIKDLAQRETSAGTTLTVSHLTTLASLNDEKLRDKLLARCYKDALTFRDLAALVQQKLGIRSNNPRGRKAKIKSPMAGSLELSKVSNKWLESIEMFDETVCEPLDKKADEYATEELADSLKQLKDTAEEIADAAKASVNKIAAAHQKVVSAIEAAEQEEAKKKAEAKTKKVKKLKIKSGKKLKKIKIKSGGKKKLKLKIKSSKSSIAKAKKKAGSNGSAKEEEEEVASSE